MDWVSNEKHARLFTNQFTASQDTDVISKTSQNLVWKNIRQPVEEMETEKRIRDSNAKHSFVVLSHSNEHRRYFEKKVEILFGKHSSTCWKIKILYGKKIGPNKCSSTRWRDGNSKSSFGIPVPNMQASFRHTHIPQSTHKLLWKKVKILPGKHICLNISSGKIRDGRI